MSSTSPPSAAPNVMLVACVKQRASGSPSCAGRGMYDILAALRAELDRRGDSTPIQEVLCLGQCAAGPTLRLKGGAFFTGMTVARVGDVCDAVAEARAEHAPNQAVSPPDGTTI